jgi:hypothetical protein
MKIVSQKQAAFLGAAASGRVKRPGAPSPAKAHKMLAENRGMKMRALPVRASASRAVRRVSTRGRR